MKATVLACVLVLGSQLAHGVPLPRVLTLNGRPTLADATVLKTTTDEKPWVSLHFGQPDQRYSLQDSTFCVEKLM